MQINLVTGYTGEAHIKSEDDALLNSFLAGQDNSVINLESEFNDTDCDISCDALVGGRLTRTDEAVNLTFTKPSSGYYRYDGVYIVYKKVTSGIESAELVYCEGTENASQATAEQNIGQPTISADVVASSVLQLYTVVWGNAQTKTVTKSYKNHTYKSLTVDGHFAPSSKAEAYIKSGLVFLNLYLITSTATAAETEYTVCSDDDLKPLFAFTQPGITKKIALSTPYTAKEYFVSVSANGEVTLTGGGTTITATDTVDILLCYPVAEV